MGLTLRGFLRERLVSENEVGVGKARLEVPSNLDTYLTRDEGEGK